MKNDLSPIGEAEDVTVTLPAADDWINAMDKDGQYCMVPYWDTPGEGLSAYRGGVDHEGDYREDLTSIRKEALALLAAVTAAERYLARQESP